MFPSTGTKWESWTVQGTAITDLQVIDANTTPTSAVQPTAPSFPTTSEPISESPAPPPQVTTEQAPSQRQPSSFVDPAILSYAKSPIHTRTQKLPVEAPATPIKSMLAEATKTLPTNGSPFVAEPGNVDGTHDARKISQARKTHKAHDVAAASPRPASEIRQTAGLGIQDGGEGQGQGQAENGAKKKVRRGQKKKGTPSGAASSDPPAVMNSEVSRNGNDMDGSVKRGKGWRQTPLLQPSPQATSPAEQAPAKKQTRKQREKDQESQANGWATEDATDVQDMGDFDFEASNKLFDKKGVFDRLRQDDTTADEDRLVSHNKVAPRPGTYGGKNLHPTENVLSPNLAPKYNSNEVDSTSDADTEHNFANGRSSSKHSTSRVALGKKQPSRQNSLQVDGKPHPLTASMSSDRGGLSRSVTSLASRGGRAVPSIATSSPRPDRTRSPQSAITPFTKTHAPLSAVAQEPRFFIQQTLSMCPVLHPSALETLEAETVSRYGLTHDAITESAARCVAEIAMGMFDPFGGSRRGSRANTMRGSMTSSMLQDRTSIPVVVILAGNNALGARAVAAARHLVGRHCKIIVAEAQFESTEAQDVQMRTQTAMLKRMQKAGASIRRGPWRKANNYIKSLSGPPAVIIDALLAGSTYESLLGSNARYAAEAQKEAHEMIDWANRSRAPVLSVGCPSGVSGRDGSATVVEGEPLAVRPDKVLCLGAPMLGLLEAMKNGETWGVSLADIGINIALRSEEAVAFGAQWVAELQYVEDDAAGEAVQ